MYDADLQLALAAARAAGAAVLRHFGRPGAVRYKVPRQPVSAADLEANAILERELLGARPGDGWLSEETADSPARLERRRVWVVDPIDGTNAFVAGIPEFAVCVALVEDGEPVLGVVLNPASGECYHAAAGQGAYRDGARIHVAPPAAPGERTLLVSRSELRRGEFDELGGDWRLRPLGGTAYRMAKVADGTGHAFFSRSPKSEWDVCAPALLVREAGGQVSDAHGRALRFNRRDVAIAGVLVAEPESYPLLLAQLRPR